MKQFFGTIYQSICLVNNKIYIGKTINFNKRKQQHIKSSLNVNCPGHNTHFHRAIRKYGINNFQWKILENNISIIVLNEKEKQYIEMYNSFKGGYNETFGGEGSFGYKHKNSTRNLISENTLKQIKEKGHPSLGIPKSEQSKVKNMNNQPTRKQIICNETKKIFSSTKECSRKMNIDYRTLCRHLKKEKSYNSIKGNTFSYI